MNEKIIAIEFKDIIEFLESSESNLEKLNYLWSLKLNVSRLLDSINHINLEQLPAPSKTHKYYKNRPLLYELLTYEFGVNFEFHDNTEDSLIAFLKSAKRRFNDLLHRIDKEILYFSEISNATPSKKKINVQPQKKIKWLGTEGEITYLFELLYKEGYLDNTFYSEKYSIIAQLFNNKYGKDFNNKQLSQAVRLLRNNEPKHSLKFKKIVSEIKNK